MVELFRKEKSIELQEKWLAAKNKEEQAKIERLNVEDELIKFLEINPEQSKSTSLELIRFTCGYTTKWDSKVIDRIDLTKYKEEEFPFRLEIKEDSKKMIGFQVKYPDLYKDLAIYRSQTVKKVSFMSKEKKEEQWEKFNTY